MAEALYKVEGSDVERQFLVFSMLIIILLFLAHSFMWSNSSRRHTSVFSGIMRLVSSAYLNKMFMIEIGCKSPSIIAYSKGPNPDPCIILRFIASINEITLPILHIWLRSVKNDITQFTITGGRPRLLTSAIKFHDLQYQMPVLRSVAGASIQPAACLKRLGVLVDLTLSMDRHVTSFANQPITKFVHYAMFVRPFALMLKTTLHVPLWVHVWIIVIRCSLEHQRQTL